MFCVGFRTSRCLSFGPSLSVVFRRLSLVFDQIVFLSLVFDQIVFLILVVHRGGYSNTDINGIPDAQGACGCRVGMPWHLLLYAL